MKIEILGTGCHHCVQLDLLVADVVKTLGLQEVEIRRADDEHKIRHYMPLDAIPGLVINGSLVSERVVPEQETLIRWLSQV
jgi:hypothetical protein